MTEKKDWKVTLSYNIQHKDTYLIQNVQSEQLKNCFQVIYALKIFNNLYNVEYKLSYF